MIVRRLLKPTSCLPALALVLCGALPVGLGGCDGHCTDAGCEDSFPRTVLAVHGPAVAGTVDVWEDASARVEGARVEGAGWCVGGVGGSLVVGQPETDAVVVIEDPLGEAGVAVRWTGHQEEAGHALAVGDVDGDGSWDLWVGSPGADLERGAVSLIRDAAASGSGALEGAGLRVVGRLPGERLGSVVVRCGDLTGDGLDDWLMSAPRHSGPESLSGGVLLVRSERLAGASGEVEPDELGPTWWGDQVGAAAGLAMSCTHDLDGDGVVDAAIGAPWRGEDDAGGVFLLSGAAIRAGEMSSAVLDEVADSILLGPYEDGTFGSALVTGDLDGDGRVELVVGAPGYAHGRGRVLVFRGQDLEAGFMEHRMTLSAPRDREPGDHVGSALSIADLDGDGRVDLLVGAPDWVADGAFDAGRLSVWRGRSVEEWGLTYQLDSDEDLAIVGTRPFQRVGRAMLAVDLDGDGASEVVLPTRAR